MGRRSSHKPDELRELIITSATDLIDSEGLAGISARAIARQIGYSPGTIYNIFEDLDDLILTVEQRLLERLAVRLAHVPPSSDPVQHLCNLAAAYLAFTQEEPRLWNLLSEHYMPAGWQVPVTFLAKFDALLDEVGKAITPLTGTPESAQQSARVLWAGIHGITSLATAEKLSHITPVMARALVDDLVRTYAAGLTARQPKRKRNA